MSAETKKVLELLAAGKISPEDAERLLDKLSGSGTTAHADAPNSQSATGNTASTAGAARPRYICIQIDRPGKDDINMRVPLSSMRGSRHWMAFLPIRLADRLADYGLDFGSLDKMDEEEFRRAMEQINVDIQGRSGKRVRIYAE